MYMTRLPISQVYIIAMARFQNISGPTAGSGGTPGGDGGDDQPRRLTAVEKGKGKKLATKKRKANDREAEVAEAVEAAVEAAERGGRSGALRIGSNLMPAQRRAVLQVEAQQGTPPSTIMLGGRHVQIYVTESAQEEPEAEAEAQVAGPTQVQQEEQPLRRSTHARTQAASRTGTQGQSTSSARSTPGRATPAPRAAPAKIHKDYTQVPTQEIQELRFAPFPT